MLHHFDTNITIGLRRKMIESLKKEFESRHIKNYENVLVAMNSVPRHRFIQMGFEHLAYQNTGISLEQDQTISKPFTVAFQTYLLDVMPNDKILEIGTGSGYQAAVLDSMQAKVYTLERQEYLYSQVQSVFESLNLSKINSYLQDGFLGLEKEAPFDKIIITCGAPEVPQTLKDQLKIGGYMVVPMDDQTGNQDMKRYIKLSDSDFYEEVFEKFIFVPMLNGINNMKH